MAQAALRALAILGAATSLWAVFLWRELLRARAGETPFCGFGESVDCGTLWSAAFASTVHQSTGVPVAGWGLVWGLVATFLPIAALASRQNAGRRAAASSAIVLTAAAGVAGLVVLLAASAAEGLFCTSCALTYLLTVAYAAVAFPAGRTHTDLRSPRGVTLAMVATAIAYLAVLYPGLRTPASLGDEGQRALEAEGRSAEANRGAGAAAGPVETDRARDQDRRLQQFVAGLNLQTLQGLVDTLYLYRDSPDLNPDEPRVLAAGSAAAPVLITEFSDTLCGHCADLHETVAYISTLLPPDSFKLDARHFPLDGNCNPHLQIRGPESVRCLAARAQICVEESGGLFELAGRLFEHQDGLTPEQVFELAAPFIGRAELRECVDSPATARKLSDDVEYAWRYRPEGTPLVVVNGRRGHQFGPFLYAIILADGDPDHPAFASLPAPSAAAIEGGAHIGHNH